MIAFARQQVTVYIICRDCGRLMELELPDYQYYRIRDKKPCPGLPMESIIPLATKLCLACFDERTKNI
jgi:hypothetical protein